MCAIYIAKRLDVRVPIRPSIRGISQLTSNEICIGEISLLIPVYAEKTVCNYSSGVTFLMVYIAGFVYQLITA